MSSQITQKKSESSQWELNRLFRYCFGTSGRLWLLYPSRHPTYTYTVSLPVFRVNPWAFQLAHGDPNRGVNGECPSPSFRFFLPCLYILNHSNFQWISSCASLTVTRLSSYYSPPPLTPPPPPRYNGTMGCEITGVRKTHGSGALIYLHTELQSLKIAIVTKLSLYSSPPSLH